MSKYLKFIEKGDSLIVANKKLERLGIIIFYQSWNQYVFNARPSAVFSEECLSDIIVEIQKKNKEKKEKE